MILPIRLGERSYDVIVSRGALARAGELLDLDRRVLILTDSGVPARYAAAVAKQAKAPTVFTVPAGEGSKSLEGLSGVLSAMFRAGLTRGDCVVAVGGGVCGDLGGFAASVYQRGIDFYNIPTTLLSQVDSSIGGKTAINFEGVKNTVGSFWQPRRVLIDPDTLATLDRRQFAAGLCEAVKMAFTSDADLFRSLEQTPVTVGTVEPVIEGALRVKRAVVEMDEKESGPRKILNFGHTFGHGIEAAVEPALYHGECVALGMLPMCAGAARERLLRVLTREGLPTVSPVGAGRIMEAVAHDKKKVGDGVDCVLVDEVGQGRVERLTLDDLRARAETCYGK